MTYVVLRSFCAAKLPKVGSPAYEEMIELATGQKASSTTGTIDLSRLSVADVVPEDEQDTNEISPPKQRQMLNHVAPQTAKSTLTAASAPTNRSLRSNEHVNTVIKNLNLLAARNMTREMHQHIVEPTPFWSPSPLEDIRPVSIRQPIQEQARAMPLQEVVNLDHIEDDDDWDLVDDDLERSFLDSLPSACNEAAKYQPAATIQIRHDSNDALEDGIMQSIEKENVYNDENTYSRRGFLRGLTRHAASLSPPTQDTPSKMPRNLSSQRRGLAKTVARRDHGGNGMIMRTATNTALGNAQPATNLRTKVPVIIRKKIVDY